MASAVRKIISPEQVYTPFNPYNQAVLVNNILYVSGQLGANAQLQLQDGIENQTRQALQNLGYILAAAGATFNNVVKVTLLISDLNNFDIINKVCREFFTENYPARCAYQVARLPLDGLIEVEAIAVIGDIVTVS